MDKAHIILEIVLLLQGTPLDSFARDNFALDNGRPIVRCALRWPLGTVEGEACKRGVATAMRRYSYRFTNQQVGLLADLYVEALNQLEPGALPRVRERMCDARSDEAQRDADAARAICERLSVDF